MRQSRRSLRPALRTWAALVALTAACRPAPAPRLPGPLTTVPVPGVRVAESPALTILVDTAAPAPRDAVLLRILHRGRPLVGLTDPRARVVVMTASGVRRYAPRETGAGVRDGGSGRPTEWAVIVVPRAELADAVDAVGLDGPAGQVALSFSDRQRRALAHVLGRATPR